jgi:hypothetical protein
MKSLVLGAALLVAFAAPATAQDIGPAIDPGLAATAAANREALELDAARRGGRQRAEGVQTRRGGARLGRRAVEQRRALRRARRRAAMGW